MVDLDRLLGFGRTHKDALLAVGLVVAAGAAFWVFLPVLTPFLIALVLAYLLEPLLQAVSRLKLSRISSVLLIYVLFGLAAVGIGVPVLVNITSGLIGLAHGLETADLQARAVTLVERYREVVVELPLPESARAHVQSLVSDPKEVQHILVAVFEKLRGVASAVLRRGAGLITTFLSAGVQFMLVPVLLFYFMLEFRDLDDGFLAMVPGPYRPWMRGFLDRVDRTLGGFIRGQLLIAALFGATMTVGLWVIGIRYAFLLGPLSGVANLVPYLGVVVGLVPAFFLALWQGGLGMGGLLLCGQILILFVILQLLDGYVFQPRILGPSVELHPLWIMLALAIGEHVMGLAGMMLAVPVAAVLRVILEDLYPLVYGSAILTAEGAAS